MGCMVTRPVPGAWEICNGKQAAIGRAGGKRRPCPNVRNYFLNHGSFQAKNATFRAAKRRQETRRGLRDACPRLHSCAASRLRPAIPSGHVMFFT